MSSANSLSPDLHKATAQLPSPRISEIVLQTAQYESMRDWYSAVLGLSWSIENPGGAPENRRRFAGSPKQTRASDVRSCFMFLDRSPVHGQVLALFELPELSGAPAIDPGLNHFQFRHANLAALFDRVELLLGSGLEAHRASNHGPVTSYYFSDPDQNVVELCCNNFDDPAKLKAFIDSDAFRKNPSGVDVDPKGFISRFRAGEPLHQLLQI
ncbi:VOC family protein [Bradyrhizobium liaoningense]|uniref:VOC family protein n=1 Tax=Bradyrhizobium liaoningense TaxID=43992 RepID=UPI001BA9DC85|nr:VOC family protein [Bradyrhizobium liaoningense]MBR0706984.1 VOC family protein [Bradyrhizobium liaoningense]